MAVFDGIAGSYDQWYRTKTGGFIDRVETGLAFEMFRAEKGMNVLDVGCGTGNFSLKLAGMGCRVTGIDLSGKMLEIGEQKASGLGLDIKFLTMDVYKLEFPDEYFDAVFSVAAFEFVSDPAGAMDEIFRVVKKGGHILIGTINGDSSWGELYSSQGQSQDSVFRHACFKTPDDMKRLKSQNLLAVRQCLFVPPGAAEDDFCMEKEAALSKSERGGFICALWKK